jgi:hypothetical protein
MAEYTSQVDLSSLPHQSTIDHAKSILDGLSHIVTPFSAQSPSSLQSPVQSRGIVVAQSRWSAAPGSHLPCG